MHNHAPDNYICPFCLFLQGIQNQHVYSVAADTVYRDAAVTALISAHQWPHNQGHVIIIPNQHFENLYDLPLPLATVIHRICRTIALAMKAAYSCEGVSTRQHNEPAGGQDVWHYHLHVFPRYREDNLYISGPTLMPAAVRANYATQLRAEMKAPGETDSPAPDPGSTPDML